MGQMLQALIRLLITAMYRLQNKVSGDPTHKIFADISVPKKKASHDQARPIQASHALTYVWSSFNCMSSVHRHIVES